MHAMWYTEKQTDVTDKEINQNDLTVMHEFQFYIVIDVQIKIESQYRTFPVGYWKAI